MQNTFLIGLSRQVTLERQMDVIANNVANVNTNGFKADRSLFQEYLMPGAREDNFAAGRDRRLSHVMDRATFRDFAQGAAEPTKNPLDVAIDGDGFFVVQTPAGERYTRDGSFQINNQGQLVNASGYPVLGSGGPIQFQQTDKQINIASDGNVTVLEGTGRVDSVRGKLRLVRFAHAASAREGRLQPLFRQAPRSPTPPRGAPGLCRKVQRQLGARNEPPDRGDAHLHANRIAAAAAARPAPIGDRQARRHAGLTRESDPCARSTPLRPEWRHRNSTFR